jgi:hypothetical protein
MRIKSFVLLLVLAVSFSVTLKAEQETQVNVVVDMTAEGKAVLHPTALNPTYYFPIIGGYKEMGATVAGEKIPAVRPIIHELAVELSKQGYLVVSKKNPTPDIILVMYWGYMNPDVLDLGESGDPGDPSSKVQLNQNQMLALVAGNTLRNIQLNFEKEDIMQAAEDDRYFLALNAYDYKLYHNSKKKVLLWQAKLSTPSAGVDLDQVLPILIKAGGPMFGKETIRPELVTLPTTPEGKVEVGTPRLKEFQNSNSIK